MSVEPRLFDCEPQQQPLRLIEHGGLTHVMCGRQELTYYQTDDITMRNVAIVVLTTTSGRTVKEVAELFNMNPSYFSTIRTKARDHGLAGLVSTPGVTGQVVWFGVSP